MSVPQPYKHQLDAVEFFKDKANGNLFFEMGTGKTRSAIMIQEQWEMELGRELRTLILCPPVVTYNWKDEKRKFSNKDPDSIFVLNGTGKKKAETINDKIIPYFKNRGDIITNYESLLSTEVYTAIQKWEPELIIYDEVHMLKTCSSKRSKLCHILSLKAKRILGLTGTPLLNNSLDLYGIFRAVDCGDTFGKNKNIFISKYLININANNPHVNYPNYKDNPASSKELNHKIYSKSIRKLKSDCLDLPDLIKITRLAEWGVKQKQAYESLKKEFLAFIDTQRSNGEPDSVTANLAIVKAMRMLQVASGFVMLDSGEIHEFDQCPKLDLTEELLQEIVTDNNQKCIIWAAYKHNYKMLEKVCKKLKLNYCFITGEQNTNEKRESELAFQNDPNMKVLIANMASGGVGVNLTAASHSIVYSRSFSLAHSLQSEARNHRSGSEIHDKIIKIDIAIKGSLDEQVMGALNNKTQISREILDLVR